MALLLHQTHAQGLALLERAMAKLRPVEATVLRMHDLEGRPLSDVGEELGIRHPGVYATHDRAMKRLDAILRADGVTEMPPREDEL